MCTESCGQVETPDTEELLEAFEIVAHDALGFLGPDHGLRPLPAATFNLEDGEPTPVSPSMARYPFEAVLEYSGPGHPVRLRYGDREYQLVIEIALNGAQYQPLHAWLDSLGIEYELAYDAWISTPTSLARHTRRLAHTLRDNFEAIVAAGTPSVVGNNPPYKTSAITSSDMSKLA